VRKARTDTGPVRFLGEPRSFILSPLREVKFRVPL
jgi:hypothetical protein